jgi:hypothetical protein
MRVFRPIGAGFDALSIYYLFRVSIGKVKRILVSQSRGSSVDWAQQLPNVNQRVDAHREDHDGCESAKHCPAIRLRAGIPFACACSTKLPTH